MNLSQKVSPTEDTPDLSDMEVASAIVTSSKEEVSEQIVPLLTCATCDTRHMLTMSHRLYRKKPNLFWRCTVVCENYHTFYRLMQANWVGKGTPEGEDGLAWESKLSMVP